MQQNSITPQGERNFACVFQAEVTECIKSFFLWHCVFLKAHQTHTYKEQKRL